ncbi:MAG: universal stress protein [Planctomycetaceae bacterium]|nr:universal stress protein [Planctomycetaceae bacterium]
MPLFRTILFAADFSGRSRAAFQAACSLAHVQKTRLFVLHVAEPMLAEGLPLAPGEPGAWIPLGDDGLAQIEALEDRLRAFYAPACPIDVTYHVRDGLAVEEILRMSDEIGSDLIVVGTHGRTGLRRLLAGSVAESVLHEARRPVLAVRCADPARRAARPARVLLHPTDFSGCSEAALRVARALARDHGARLVVLYVAPRAVIAEGTAVIDDQRLDQDILEEIRGRIEGPDLESCVETLLGQGDPAAVILRVAREVRAGLIVMGTHGRTGLGRLLMGSVAETVLRGSRGPVLVVKAPRQEKVARPVGPAGKSLTLF